MNITLKIFTDCVTVTIHIRYIFFSQIIYNSIVTSQLQIFICEPSVRILYSYTKFLYYNKPNILCQYLFNKYLTLFKTYI